MAEEDQGISAEVRTHKPEMNRDIMDMTPQPYIPPWCRRPDITTPEETK